VTTITDQDLTPEVKRDMIAWCADVFGVKVSSASAVFIVTNEYVGGVTQFIEDGAAAFWERVYRTGRTA
jgi:hypothetical protein